MLQIITLIELIISVLLIISILLQNRGAGLSGTFGGNFGGYYTRRGMEKFLVYFSITLSTLFLLLAIIRLLIANQG